MWRLVVISCAALAISVSGFSLIQDAKGSGCLELQCPAAAIDFGIKKLVNDETWVSEACRTCKQCTDNGYSVCLRVRDSRAARQVGSCSCSHVVPSNCHNDLRQTTHPANITMRLYTVCYSSVLQAPPKPMGLNENETVTITVEPFWQEAYWKQLTVDNVTLFYEFNTKNPERCEGQLSTTNDGIHTCKSSHSVSLDASEPDVVPGDADAEEYDHSENYASEDLLPEMQYDRAVFLGAKIVRFYYTAVVRRPRQLSATSARDQQISDGEVTIRSETLDFDLKPEVYGSGLRTGEQPPPSRSEDSATSIPAAADDADEDVSEEQGGTDFFVDDSKKPDDKDAKASADDDDDDDEDVDDAAVEVNLADVKPTKLGSKEEKEKVKGSLDKIELSEPRSDADKEAEAETEKDKKEPVEDESEEKEKEEDVDHDEKKDEDKEKEAEEEEDEKHVEDTEKETHEEEDEEAGGDDKKTSEEATTEKEEHKEEDAVAKTTVEEAADSAEDDDEDKDGDDDDDVVEGSGSEDNENLNFFEKFARRADFPRVRLIFLVTLVAFIAFIVLVCLVRHRKSFCGQPETKTANGYRYSSASGTVRGTELEPIPAPRTKTSVQDKRLSADEVALVQQSDVEAERNTLRELVRSAASFNPSKVDMGISVGVGQFGSIHRAIFNSFNGSVHDVNIYLLKNVYRHSAKQLEALTASLRLNIVAGAHHNVVTLRAIAQDTSDVLLMWEPLAQPSLQGVLRESRCARFGPDSFKSASFLSAERLVVMAIGCCVGVEHLVKRGVLHPHLAAANVLVAERGVVKISGFGLAEHNALSGSADPKPTPMRWQSPEHFIPDATVDERSVVWSLGVLVWEIFSLGGTPFASIRQPQQFIDSMRDGSSTLDNISYCEPAISQLLLACTSHSSHARPDLRTIIRRLECISADAKTHIDLSLHDAFPYVPIASQLEQQTPNST